MNKLYNLKSKSRPKTYHIIRITYTIILSISTKFLLIGYLLVWFMTAFNNKKTGELYKLLFSLPKNGVVFFLSYIILYV